MQCMNISNLVHSRNLFNLMHQSWMDCLTLTTLFWILLLFSMTMTQTTTMFTQWLCTLDANALVRPMEPSQIRMCNTFSQLQCTLSVFFNNLTEPFSKQYIICFWLQHNDTVWFLLNHYNFSLAMQNVPSVLCQLKQSLYPPLVGYRKMSKQDNGNLGFKLKVFAFQIGKRAPSLLFGTTTVTGCLACEKRLPESSFFKVFALIG